MPKPESLEPASASDRRPGVAPLIVFLTVFIDLLGFGIVIPFLPMYAERMRVGAFGTGCILAIYSLTQLLCAPLLGRVSDRVGRRPIIMLGLFGSSLGYLIYGFADSFFWLLISRAVHGAFAATVSTAQAYIADTTSESKRAHGMGMIGAAFGLGFVLGPAIGGLLGHASLRTPVFFAAALCFANLIFAAFALPESHFPSGSHRLRALAMLEPILTLPRKLTRHKLSTLFSIAFLVTFAIAMFEATFALMVPRIYGYGPFGVGGLLAFAGLVQALAQGHLLGKIVHSTGELRLIRIGIVSFALGIAPMASTSSHVLLLMMLGLLSLGYGFASPSVAALISKRTASHSQGEVLGINQSALSLARVCGPIAGGCVYGALGPVATYSGAGLAAIVALALTRWVD
jgi:MFS transporter, DHA1 family, tetracycline resistance protein